MYYIRVDLDDAQQPTSDVEGPKRGVQQRENDIKKAKRNDIHVIILPKAHIDGANTDAECG